MRCLASALVASTLLLVAPPILAQSDDSSGESAFGRTGVYVGLGTAIGIGLVNKDQAWKRARYGSNPPPSIVSTEIDSSVGFGGRVGSRVHRYAAVEVQVEYLPSIDWNIFWGSSPAGILNVRMVTTTANLKLFPLSGRIQPFALIGGGATFADVTTSLRFGGEDDFGSVLRAGGGIDAYLTEHIALSTEVSYVLPEDLLEDLHYLSIGLGLQYKF